MIIDAERKEAIRAALLQWCAEQAVPDTELLRRYELGNAAYFNVVKNGKYDDKYPKAEYWNKLAQTIGFTDGAAPAPLWNHVDLPSYESILAYCTLAHESREVRVIDAPTGSGKTHALESYFRNPIERGSKVYYLRAADEHLSPAEFMRRLLRLMGIKKVDNIATARLTEKAIEAMRERGGLFIFDELEYMSNATLKQLRKLIYETERKTGFILSGAGLASRLEKLAQTRSAEANGWAQFWSRVKWRTQKMLPFGYQDGNEERNKHWREVVQICLNAHGIKAAKVISYMAKNTQDLRDVSRITMDVLRMAEPAQVDEQVLAAAMNRNF